MNRRTKNRIINTVLVLVFLFFLAVATGLLYDIMVNDNIRGIKQKPEQENLHISNERSEKLFKHLYRK